MKHELNLEFMDLPPPSQLAACNTLHCDIMLRAPPGLVIILDYPHGRIDTIDLEGYIRLIHYRRIKPQRIMRIAILLQSEYDAIHRPLRLLYNRSTEQLEQYHIKQPIIWERQEKRRTMTKTSNKNVVARKAAPKKVATSVDHIETPTVVEVVTKPAKKTQEELGLSSNSYYTPAKLKKANRTALLALLKPEVNGIRVGAIDWTVPAAIMILQNMTNNQLKDDTVEGVQRSVKWSQVSVLLDAMRASADTSPDNHAIQWFDGTNIGVIADNDDGIDSRHRNIARVLHTGNVWDIDTMLRILYNHPARPSEIDPNDLLSPPIKGFAANGSNNLKIDEPNWCLPMSIGCKRKAFLVIDGDQAERTGADALTTSPESSRMLAESGIDAGVAETALRSCDLRTTTKYVDDEIVCGSLKSGGNRHPGRYPVYSHIWAGSLVEGVYTPGWMHNAQTAIQSTLKAGTEWASENEGAVYVASRVKALGEYHVLACCTLALQAGYTDENIAYVVDQLCNGPDKGTAAFWLVKYLEEKTIIDGKGQEKTKTKVFVIGKSGEQIFYQFKTADMFTALVLCFIDGEKVYNQSQFVAACQEEKTHRLGGYDEEGLPNDIVNAAEKSVIGKVTKKPSPPKKKNIVVPDVE